MRRLLCIAFLTPFLASPAFSWGCEGHQIVALIARARLSPGASAAVDELLRAAPIDPALVRFCKDRPNDLMADSATWADDTKSQEKTAVWHYVDIPRSVKTAVALDPWCPAIGPSVDGRNRPGCITNALELEVAILRDKTRSASDRATALRYVIHFLGDIHQPLHDSDNNDQGGNCTAMQFFAEEKPVNLHAIWDYKLIEHEFQKDKMTQPAYAAALNSRFDGKFRELTNEKPMDPVAWSWETNPLADSVVYGGLVPGIPVEVPNSQSVCAAEREKVLALKISVGEAYFSKAMPVIDRQLAVAGFRLARLLNDSLQ